MLGTLCVLDRLPRTFTDGDRALLRDLGDIVVDTLELRYQTRQTFELLLQADHAARRARDVAIEASTGRRELRERDERRTTLLRAVAHDLSTPLAALSGMAGTNSRAAV